MPIEHEKVDLVTDLPPSIWFLDKVPGYADLSAVGKAALGTKLALELMLKGVTGPDIEELRLPVCHSFDEALDYALAERDKMNKQVVFTYGGRRVTVPMNVSREDIISADLKFRVAKGKIEIGDPVEVLVSFFVPRIEEMAPCLLAQQGIPTDDVESRLRKLYRDEKILKKALLCYKVYLGTIYACLKDKEPLKN